MKEQIEEMANDIAAMCPDLVDNGCGDLSCVACLARGLEQMGYCKQREGVWKFNQDGSGTCSECHFTQRGVWDYDNHQNFCGVCGAKMKGGE